jgi:hypothetical protein
LVHFWVPWNGKCIFYDSLDFYLFGTIFGHLVILLSFGILYPEIYGSPACDHILPLGASETFTQSKWIALSQQVKIFQTKLCRNMQTLQMTHSLNSINFLFCFGTMSNYFFLQSAQIIRQETRVYVMITILDYIFMLTFDE